MSRAVRGRATPEEARIFREWMSGRAVDAKAAELILYGLSDKQFDYAVMFYGDGLPIEYIAALRCRTYETVRQGVALATIRLENVLQQLQKRRR